MKKTKNKKLDNKELQREVHKVAYREFNGNFGCDDTAIGISAGINLTIDHLITKYDFVKKKD